MMKDLRFDFYDPDTSVTTPLVFDPIGWNENLAKFERSSKYWSVFLSVTLPLKFVDDDAELIRGYYYTKGIGSKLQLKIYERNIFTNLFELAESASYSTVKFSGMALFKPFSETNF